MKESSFFQIVVNRPVSIFMITAAFLVFGVLSYNRLPLSLMPSLQYPRITLRTEYKGASPYEVETLISEPIERALGILPHLTKITSISHPGLSEVICEFSWKADMKQMILEIRENLDQVRLPEGVERPLILRYDPTLDPILRLAFYGRRPITEIRKLLEEDIKQQLESLPGVASAVVRGGVSPIVMVGLKKIEMDRYKITPQQVETRLKQENINMTGGLLREGDTLYIIRILNEFKSLQDIQNLIVAYKNKVPIRLKNIAEIREQGGEQKVISRVAGKEAVEVLIYKEGEANLVKVAQRVKEFCFGRKKREKKNFFFWKKEKSVQKKFQRGPKPLIEKYKGIQIALLSDNSQFVEQSIEDVKSSALWGAFFAFLVLLLFLQNIKNTLIVALAIPLSLVVTFAPMNLLSMSLNIMSLGGLALAAGMVVDNAIVTLESIFRKQEEGLGVRESAVYGTQEIAAAIIASTLTTVAVFFPIVFVEGIGGRLFADQALTVTFALLFSLLAALFFIPSLAALEFVTGKKRLSLIWATLKRFRSLELIKEGAQKSWKQKIWLPFWLLLSLPKNLLFLAIEILGKALLLLILGVSFLVILLFKAVFGILQILLYLPYQMTNLILHCTLKTYLKLLEWIYEWKGVALTLALIFCVWSSLIVQNLGARLLPELHQGEFSQEILLPPGTELKKTDQVLQWVTRRLLPQNDLFLQLSSRAGSDEDELEGKGDRGGRLFVRLKGKNLIQQEEKAIPLVQKEFQSIPDVEVLEVKKPQLFSFRTPIEIEVKGQNLQELFEVSQKLERALKKLPLLKNTRLQFREGSPEIRVVLNRLDLVRLGLNAEQVAQLINSQFKGNTPTAFRSEGERKEIWVQLREQDRKQIQDLENLNVRPSGKTPIPLKSIARIQIARGPEQIYHIDHSRAIVISSDVRGFDLQKAVDQIQNLLEKMKIPSHISVEISGQYREMITSLQSLYLALALAAFLVYVVMASIFESFIQPFFIMFSLPFAFIGAAWSLYWLNISLNVMVLIGGVMLAGIVVNNAIVLVDKINQLRRQEGMELKKAILEGVSIRFRPILMTTLTTIFGLLPLALGVGEGAELRKPLAITVLTGLISSTLLTLIIIPLIYGLWEGLMEKHDPKTQSTHPNP